MSAESTSPILVGWHEWVSLPALGPMILKAKMDTGARTSALHAFSVELIEAAGRARVRFGVHPRQHRTDVEVFAEADVVEQRLVRDSGGHEEERIVIRTPLSIGRVTREVELTLTNRDNMQFRMLVGRSALAGFAVDPSRYNVLGTRREMIDIYRGEQS